MTLDDRKTPFFVLGVQRSGTTMLRLMLNSHPNIAVPHETVFITEFIRKLPEYGDLHVAENAGRLLADISKHPFVARGGLIADQDAILSHAIHSYADLVDAIMVEYARRNGKLRWGEKTPEYTADIDLLWALFPQCKFIHLVRDGRDVAVSQKKIEWCPDNLYLIAEDWKWKTMTCHKVGSVLGPDHFLELRYEELVLNPESTLRRICTFLDEPFVPDMLQYHQGAADVVPERSLQWHEHSVRAPDPNKLYAWKRNLSVADRIIFEDVAGDTLEYFGYERENLNDTVFTKIRKFYYTFWARW